MIEMVEFDVLLLKGELSLVAYNEAEEVYYTDDRSKSDDTLKFEYRHGKLKFDYRQSHSGSHFTRNGPGWN